MAEVKIYTGEPTIWRQLILVLIIEYVLNYSLYTVWLLNHAFCHVCDIWYMFICHIWQKTTCISEMSFLRYLYFTLVFPFCPTLPLLNYFSEGDIVPFTPLNLLDSFSYFTDKDSYKDPYSDTYKTCNQLMRCSYRLNCLTVYEMVQN